MFNDLMDNIEWFFNLHDKDKDGYITRDEVLTLSESLLVRYSSEMTMQVYVLNVSSLYSDMKSEMPISEQSAAS